MILSDKTIFLSLTIGVIIGMLYSINRAIVEVFAVKKVTVFFFDFTFVALSTVLSFLGALAISAGFFRIWQVLFEIIGALSFYFAFFDGVKAVLSTLHNILKRFWEKIRTACQKIRKTVRNLQEKVKKK